jgi:ribonuclease HI
MSKPRVTIYTDGACEPNPGPGGWAAILRSGSTEKALTGSEAKTTNNRMELTAALRALESLKEPCRVEIFTDSEYLQRGITEWMAAWKARNWKRKGGKLANLDLWQALDAALERHEVAWSWVKGHAGVRSNQRADYLARKAIPR